MATTFKADASEFLAEDKQRIALGIAYNGRYYHGWQRQPSGHISVQEKLEDALSIVANEPIKVMCAGRTDAGVHASAQVVHFDTVAQRPLRAWTHGGNMNLPDDVAIQWAQPVDEKFHARFSATARRYRYVIYNHALRPALMDKEVTWNYRPLDIVSMQKAAAHLVGTHDFSSFRAAACQANSPIRTMHHLNVIAAGDYIVLDVRANAFLHHMIRNLAGLLMKIGAGEAPPEWAMEVLIAKDRRVSAATAKPYGLYFVDAEYDDAFNLPQTPLGPHFLAPWINV
ncbi:tRNA pseudouridine(38-40) synthase TruA [Candidatus Njordibacter sp. Uisw_056]|jgi:tRNA pseudouridine38-40 synthase|uniref:tRNA pseudouridine(38-40) synthase TruA n=1 Tax=Candidatus Njordibacter sp. Uisw_056 TaxID=3230973 RepID=UPI003D41FA8E|tara:strand:+ start:17227 stop:18078 length:852 start_codon:yes stop_codon:yes gene_type:complete